MPVRSTYMKHPSTYNHLHSLHPQFQWSHPHRMLIKTYHTPRTCDATNTSCVGIVGITAFNQPVLASMMLSGRARWSVRMHSLSGNVIALARTDAPDAFLATRQVIHLRRGVLGNGMLWYTLVKHTFIAGFPWRRVALSNNECRGNVYVVLAVVARCCFGRRGCLGATALSNA